jgi:hypothetical protein
MRRIPPLKAALSGEALRRYRLQTSLLSADAHLEVVGERRLLRLLRLLDHLMPRVVMVMTAMGCLGRASAAQDQSVFRLDNFICALCIQANAGRTYPVDAGGSVVTAAGRLASPLLPPLPRLGK